MSFLWVIDSHESVIWLCQKALYSNSNINDNYLGHRTSLSRVLVMPEGIIQQLTPYNHSANLKTNLGTFTSVKMSFWRGVSLIPSSFFVVLLDYY